MAADSASATIKRTKNKPFTNEEKCFIRDFVALHHPVLESTDKKAGANSRKTKQWAIVSSSANLMLYCIMHCIHYAYCWFNESLLFIVCLAAQCSVWKQPGLEARKEMLGKPASVSEVRKVG
jgi:hypothetical protein